MTSTRNGDRSPAEFTAAALRRALLLPLALATVTGALVLGLAMHVRDAVDCETEDEHEMHALQSIYRRLSDDQMMVHNATSAALQRRPAPEVPANLVTLEQVARRHARIAQSAIALDHLLHEWMRHREFMRPAPSAPDAAEAQRLDQMRTQLDSLAAELMEEQRADQVAVRRRFAEMLMLVAGLSVVLGAAVAIYVRRDLAIVAKAFSQRLDAEQQAGRVKDEFVATLSHELKTPINAILGWTTLLRRRCDDPVTVRRALDRIERNARKQARLVDDIVDLSCIATGRLTLSRQSVDVSSTIESAIASRRAAAETKGIRIVPLVADDARAIWGDASRVRQILENLIDNAVKLAPPGGRVLVGATRAGDAIQLRVSDDGGGPPAGLAQGALGTFPRNEAASSHSQDGLGLAIARQLVELLGGTVDVKSPGEAGGAAFAVTLPRAAGHARC
ncbi:MAG: HAMP domain-containing sensor histidine kinase [Polyangiaceae bacterium]